MVVLITVANKTQYHRSHQEGEPGAETVRDSVLANKDGIPQHLDVASSAGFMVTASAESPDCQTSLQHQGRSATGQQCSGRTNLCLDAVAGVRYSLVIIVMRQVNGQARESAQRWGLRYKSPGYCGQDQAQCSCSNQGWNPQVINWFREKKGECLLSLPRSFKELSSRLSTSTGPDPRLPDPRVEEGLFQWAACTEAGAAAAGSPLVHTNRFMQLLTLNILRHRSTCALQTSASWGGMKRWSQKWLLNPDCS